TTWPKHGGAVTSALLAISIFGALTANLLSGPRVFFAMARDGVFFSTFRRIDPRFGTPAIAVVGLSLWSLVLIGVAAAAPAAEAWLVSQGLYSAPFLSPDASLFEVLIAYCVFGGSIFYLTAVLAVFVLRIRKPDAARPYRTFGYPVVPAVFVIAYVFLLGAMFLANPLESSVGLIFIALGVPVYFVFRSRSRPPSQTD
ncbi:MAG: amino acid permease, partial [Planctomycetales bacterium]